MPERTGALSLHDAVARLMGADRVLVGVDFDGTLAPLVDHPDDAVPDPRAFSLLGEIAGRPGVTVAVVSGRARADLHTRLGELPGATLVGEHGNDIGGAAAADPVIAEAETMIRGVAAEAGGATVESKPRSVTFHYRHLDDESAAPYLDRIRDWAGAHQTIRILEGKDVIELSTGDRDKGDAIRDLAGTAAVIYIGDDTTDETVFTLLGPGDVGVKVGSGPTAASHRVEDIDGVVRILEQIALASR